MGPLASSPPFIPSSTLTRLDSSQGDTYREISSKRAIWCVVAILARDLPLSSISTFAKSSTLLIGIASLPSSGHGVSKVSGALGWRIFCPQGTPLSFSTVSCSVDLLPQQPSVGRRSPLYLHHLSLLIYSSTSWLTHVHQFLFQAILFFERLCWKSPPL